MNHVARRLLVTALAAGAAVTMTPTASHATIHELVAQYCSGKGPLEPPGIDEDDTKQSFARPVLANGIVTPVVTVTNGITNVKLLVDEDHPALKVDVLRYSTFPTGPTSTLTVPVLTPDPDFPAFQNCPKLAG